MTNSQIRKKVDSLIKKAVTSYKKNGGHDWARLGESLEALRREAIDEVGIDDYSAYCKRIDEITNIIEGKYDKYFKLADNAYDHINGNKKWQELLNKK